MTCRVCLAPHFSCSAATKSDLTFKVIWGGGGGEASIEFGYDDSVHKLGGLGAYPAEREKGGEGAWQFGGEASSSPSPPSQSINDVAVVLNHDSHLLLGQILYTVMYKEWLMHSWGHHILSFSDVVVEHESWFKKRFYPLQIPSVPCGRVLVSLAPLSLWLYS